MKIGKRWIPLLIVYYAVMTAIFLYLILGVAYSEWGFYSIWVYITVSIITFFVIWLPFPLSLVILSLRVHRKLGDIKIDTSPKYLISYTLNLILITFSVIVSLKYFNSTFLGLLLGNQF